MVPPPPGTPAASLLCVHSPLPFQIFLSADRKLLTPWASASSDLRAHCPRRAKSPGKIIPSLHMLCRMETLFLGIGGMMTNQTGSPTTYSGKQHHTPWFCAPGASGCPECKQECPSVSCSYQRTGSCQQALQGLCGP